MHLSLWSSKSLWYKNCQSRCFWKHYLTCISCCGEERWKLKNYHLTISCHNCPLIHSFLMSGEALKSADRSCLQRASPVIWSTVCPVRWSVLLLLLLILSCSAGIRLCSDVDLGTVLWVKGCACGHMRFLRLCKCFKLQAEADFDVIGSRELLLKHATHVTAPRSLGGCWLIQVCYGVVPQ